MRAGPAEIQDGDKELAWEQKLNKIQNMLREPIGALVDVPLDWMEAKIVDWEPNEVPPPGAGEEDDEQTRLYREQDTASLPLFRIVATIKAPGAHAARAASGLKEE